MENKPRLYYNDSLKAAWMKREFGVKFEIELRSTTGELYDIVDVELNHPSLITSETYFVKKESEAIFAPKEGDDGYDFEKGNYWFNGILWISGGLRKNENPDNEDIKIIMRDNKQFFYCEREND